MFLCWLPSRESGHTFGQDPGHGSASVTRGGAPVPRCGLFSTSCSRGWAGGPCSHWAPQLPAQSEEAEPTSSCSLAPLPSQVFLPGPWLVGAYVGAGSGRSDAGVLSAAVKPGALPGGGLSDSVHVPLSSVCADPQEGRGTQIPPALSTVEKMERNK